MKIAFFDTHQFEKDVFESFASKAEVAIEYLDMRLSEKTAFAAKGFDAVCAFVNDKIDSSCLIKLNSIGIKLILLRSAGYNNVDITAAMKLGITVARVPGYSPNAIAEFAVGLLLNLNRKIHKAYNRVREHNFVLDGLVGFDLNGKTVGIIGAGKIGSIFARIMSSFGCQILVHDPVVNTQLEQAKNIRYVDMHTLCLHSDIISLHVPLSSASFHLINKNLICMMKQGIYIINTGRGALIDSNALVDALKSGKIGGAALDVYEEEEGIFFHDLSDIILPNDTLAQLLTFPNVIVTSHQGFLTREALQNIAQTTIESCVEFGTTGKVSPEKTVTFPPDNVSQKSDPIDSTSHFSPPSQK
jgi:D-lactate dehydrogenase